ncbi:MAG: choice-of-anchor J domain-containing protein [Candidatus Cloacimonadaceae bacterium]
MKTTLRITVLLAILLAMFSFTHAVTVQVGDGTATTAYYPIRGIYGYTYSQQIYTQSQINYAGEITKIRFFYSSGNIANNKDWTIYLGHSQRTEFTSTTDWEAPANLTQVFDGDVTDLMPATGNWMEITLNTPFNYNNTDNLIVAVYQYTPNYGSMSWGAFPSGDNTGMCYYDDNNNPDPNNPPEADARHSSINRIQFVFPDTEAPMAPVLLAPDNAAEVMNGQTLSWTMPHGSPDVSGFDLYIDSNLVVDNQPATSYTLTGLEAGEHSWYVVARNNVGVSAPSETRTFSLVNGVIIGDGTSNQQDPFNAWYGYGRSLGLYTFDQIGQLGSISTLGWNVHTAGTGAIPYKIYAKLTDDTALTQMTWADFTATATLVKEGTYTFDTVGWHQFTLDMPIAYTNGNLLIGVEANHGGSGAGTGGYPRFYYTTGNTGSHQYWRRDNTIPETNGTLNTNLPNIMMILSPLSDEPVFVVSPTEWNFDRVMINTTSSQAFSIVNGGGGTLNVTGLSPMNDGPFTVTNAPDFPVGLTLGESATFDIEYTPTATGNHTATFTVTAGAETQTITVSGECFDPIIYDYPFTDGFEVGQTHGNQVVEWTQILDDGKTKYWMANSTNTNYNREPRNGDFNATLQYNANAWLMRPFSLQAGQSYDVEVWARQDGATEANASMGIFYGTDATLDAMTNTIAEQTGLINGDYQQIRGSFIPAASGVYWIAFHGVINSTPWYISIDDIAVQHSPETPIFTYTPDAIDFGTSFANTPTAYQNVTVTNNGVGTLELPAASISIVGDDAAMFGFDATGLPLALTAYQSGVVPVRYNPTAEGTHSATLRMVYGGENYDVTLSGIALGENALFEGFESEVFPPPGWGVVNGGGSNTWARATSFPYSGVAHAQIRWNTTAHDDWLISPRVAPTAASHTFSFYGSNNSGTYDERFNVLVSTTTPEVTSFTDTLGTNVQTGSTTYTFHTYDLSAFIGQQIYVAIQAISTNQLYLLIDDVSGPDIVAEMPSAPVLLSPADGAAMVSVRPTLTWNPSAGGIPAGYKVFLGTTNPPTTEVADVTTTSYTPTDQLSGETTYYWTVKAYNDAGTSDAPTAFSFTTSPAGTVIIGDGTSSQRQPFGTYWGYEKSAALYTADQINLQGLLNFVAWDANGTSEIEVPYKIYAKNTDATSLTAESWTNFSPGMTLVKEGTHVFNTPGWNAFALDTPFEYTGGNLIIAVETDFGGNGGGQGHTFRYTTTPTSHMFWNVDNNPNPDQNGTVNSSRPNVMLGFLTNTGNISGTVTGAGNQPLAGVNVTLTEREYHATTNDAGEYQLVNVVEGNYTLTFTKHSYQTHTQNVTVAVDDELVINVTMQLLPQVTVSGTILASDTGAGLAGAAITLTGYEDYTANTTATGAFTIPNVFANNVYDYNITAAGYVSQNGQLTLAASDHDMGTITLQEVAYAPVGVNAVANDADTEVTITWLAPDPSATEITEGFESTTFPPSGWTQEITNTGSPNALGMYPTWCRIGSVTISGDLVAPIEGSYQSALYWSESHQDEWLITPGFNCPPSAYMTFNTLAFLGSEHDDHYYVKVSTDNGNNWTVLWDATAQTGGWTDYNTPITIDLSAYAGNQIKLAFHAEDPPINTGLWYIWFIDNIYIGNVISKVAFESDDFVRVSASDNLTRATTGAMTSMEISRDRAYGAKHNEPRLPRPEAVSRVNRTHRALTGYKVYRLTPGNEQNEAAWTLLNQEPTADLSIVDPAWETLANGDYRWAVKAVYTNDVLSVPSLSNTLNKFVQRGNIIGTVKDKNNNYIRGAVVTAGEYSATTNSSGAYSLSVPVGTYDVTAEADEFKSETREGVVVTANSNTTVNFILQPVSNDDPQIPVVATMLNGNFPNPFNPETTISYSVKEAGRVKIEVYNIKGQLVKTLVNEDQITGHYKLVFDGKDASGRSISSGVYMLRMTAPGYQKATKMILMQ